ncbi:hypothetical protein [Aurantiacibacter sediminis]|uniref:Uncharacterized protein n=1 Tax=Aurantiacibacter sediminis TaxID=2793064 RepID=A0ABS0N1I6_9SPHN|nr:hypothetical protein [Aurantiacibacter sediminis]MBH5321597.1 hypothetical protein [Aurantiacibacter sediminis]
MNIEQDSLRSSPFGTNEWENEGGSTAPPPVPDGMPKGVSARWVLEYRVGDYRYTSLADAKSEQQRRNRMADKAKAEARSS